MVMMKSYKDLEVWQIAMNLTEEIYRLTHSFPKEEQYGLTSQVRRATTSIVANIAEGFGRFTFPDKAHKYTIARGECTEVEAYLLIAIRVKITTEESTQKALELSNQVGRMLSGLIRSTKNSQNPSIPVFQYSSTLQ
jgi:four helix bundle protein